MLPVYKIMKKRQSIKTFLIFITILAFGSCLIFSTQILQAADTEISDNNEPVEVDIKLFTFKPKVLEIPVGTKVVWSNGDAVDHSVTQGTPGKPGAEFDSGYFTKGGRYSYTFNEAGEYEYFCKRHESMRGKIIVVK